MRMDRAKEGLWLHLIESVPLPERDELLSLVGRGLVDTNETLWNEKNILQEIVYEIHGKSTLTTPRTVSTNPGNFSPSHSLSSSMSSSVFTTMIHSTNNDHKFNKVVPSSSSGTKESSIQIHLPPSTHSNNKFQAKRLFKDALTFSQLHYNNDLLNDLGSVSLSSFEYIDELQLLLKQTKRHHLSELILDLEMIRKYLFLENEKLQEVIQSLQGIIDKDMQLDDDDIPIHNNNSSSSSHHPSTSKPFSSNGAPKSEVITSKVQMSKRLPMRTGDRSKSRPRDLAEEKMNEASAFDEEVLKFESFQKDTSSQEFSTSSNQHLDYAYTPSKKNSRFREKIKDAQLELYLVDDL